jgi:guanylate kinase
MKKGKIFVISAPSGSGKTTLCKRLLKECGNLVVSKSFTTRPLRRGEKNNRDYIFVTKNEFEKQVRRKNFLEWANVFGNLYGTPKDFVDKKINSGKSVLLVIDVQGAFKAKRRVPSAVLIFIMPPSIEELKKRLQKRKSDGAKEIKIRLKIAQREIRKAKKYDYIVVNEKIEHALLELKKIVAQETKPKG